MVAMDGVNVRVGMQVWFGGWGTVTQVQETFFMAEFNGSQYIVKADGTSPQSRRPARVVYWTEPLPTFPESMKINEMLRENHALLMKHMRNWVKTYQQAKR